MSMKQTYQMRYAEKMLAMAEKDIARLTAQLHVVEEVAAFYKRYMNGVPHFVEPTPFVVPTTPDEIAAAKAVSKAVKRTFAKGTARTKVYPGGEVEELDRLMQRALSAEFRGRKRKYTKRSAYWKGGAK